MRANSAVFDFAIWEKERRYDSCGRENPLFSFWSGNWDEHWYQICESAPCRVCGACHELDGEFLFIGPSYPAAKETQRAMSFRVVMLAPLSSK
jgi:hypothetical protein